MKKDFGKREIGKKTFKREGEKKMKENGREKALTSGWGIANCPWMVYACPPAKKTGGIAGLGR